MLVAGVLATMQAAIKVDRIEPTDWYVGLNSVPSVQQMVYGQSVMLK